MIKNERNRNNTVESNSKDSLNSHSSTTQSNAMKRLLVMMLITFFFMFAGFQSAPITQAAGEPCDLVCGKPFTDPNDGQCYQMCCPVDEKCKRACELRPCLKKTPVPVTSQQQ
jgi:hypothetical protein